MRFHITITVLVVHAPTRDKGTAKYREFLQLLSYYIKRSVGKAVVLGDLNAVLSADECPRVIGCNQGTDGQSTNSSGQL
eukprot:6886483-Prorocentrum_lima.AAC.1